MKLRALPLLLLLPTGLAVANEAHRMLSQLSEEKRRIALAHVVRSSGDACASATETFYQGSDRKGTALWNARCSNGQAYSISLYSDAQGSTKVLDCKVLKAVAGVQCFKRL